MSIIRSHRDGGAPQPSRDPPPRATTASSCSAATRMTARRLVRGSGRATAGAARSRKARPGKPGPADHVGGGALADLAARRRQRLANDVRVHAHRHLPETV